MYIEIRVQWTLTRVTAVIPVKNIITHLPTHNKQHTLDTHCKFYLDSKFLERSTLMTMVYSQCLQTIAMLYLFKKTQTLIHNQL